MEGAERQGRTDEFVSARERADVVVDGLVGYGLKSTPRGLARAFIEVAAVSPLRVLALDVPSGLDASTGDSNGPVVKAEATMTLALPKIGLYDPAARTYVGDLYLADIGVPPTLCALPSLGLVVPPFFGRSDILRVDY